MAQNIETSVWKFEMINIYFIMRLSWSHMQNYSTWVIVDMMTKPNHILPVKTTNTTEEYPSLYIQDVVRLHGVSMSIISDRGVEFWNSFRNSLGSKVNLSTTFYTQTSGHEKQNLESIGYVEGVCYRF